MPGRLITKPGIYDAPCAGCGEFTMSCTCREMGETKAGMAHLIEEILEFRCASKCMDSEEDRKEVASVLAEWLSQTLLAGIATGIQEGVEKAVQEIVEVSGDK